MMIFAGDMDAHATVEGQGDDIVVKAGEDVVIACEPRLYFLDSPQERKKRRLVYSWMKDVSNEEIIIQLSR